MINFEEEIRKYRPSLEIDQAEDAIYNTDMTDMVDVLMKMAPDNGIPQPAPTQTATPVASRKTQRK